MLSDQRLGHAKSDSTQTQNTLQLSWQSILECIADIFLENPRDALAQFFLLLEAQCPHWKKGTSEPRLLSGKRTVEGVLIGRLYREVHFCFPKYDAGLGSSLAEEERVLLDEMDAGQTLVIVWSVFRC